jgi:ABC-type transport system involved in multi-copper enzyme maturation permease subunit
MITLAALITWITPVWLVVVGAAIAAAALFGIYQLMRLVVPKVAAITMTTFKESVSSPFFIVILLVGACLLILLPFFPYNTFGEDVKMLMDSGLTLIKVLAIILALWTASISIAEEIEGRTALTLLSKPIGRSQFIVGKFFGIIGPVACLFIVLGSLFLATVSYKVVYDARETGNQEPTTAECREEMVRIAPGLALGLLEAVALGAVSVAISTRLPMLPNLILCASIFAMGHLAPLIVNSRAGQYGLVQFIGQLIATVLPVLDHFDIQAAVATGSTIPLSYLGWAALYCVLYSTVALLLALILFEDRDVA